MVLGDPSLNSGEWNGIFFESIAAEVLAGKTKPLSQFYAIFP